VKETACLLLRVVVAGEHESPAERSDELPHLFCANPGKRDRTLFPSQGLHIPFPVTMETVNTLHGEPIAQVVPPGGVPTRRDYKLKVLRAIRPRARPGSWGPAEADELLARQGRG
jgi:hypothetical protein